MEREGGRGLGGRGVGARSKMLNSFFVHKKGGGNREALRMGMDGEAVLLDSKSFTWIAFLVP